MKLNLEDKQNIWNLYKTGKYTIYRLSKMFGIDKKGMRYLIRFIELYGLDELTAGHLTHYSTKFKEEAVKYCLDNHSYFETALKFKLHSIVGVRKWLNEYIKNGYNFIDKKRGCSLNGSKSKRETYKGNQGITEEKLRAYYSNRIHKKIERLSFAKRKVAKEEIVKVITELRQNLNVSLNLILDELKKHPELPTISKSDYYYTLNKIDKDLKNDDLMNKIIEIYYHHKNRYGYRRITLELKRQGYKVNDKKVRRIMRRLNLQGIKRNKRKYSSYKGEIGKVAPNIINRDFFSNTPNKKWYTDITEFNLRGEKLYLSPILDGCAGDIVSYQISKSPDLKQVMDMATEAISNNNTKALIFHTDQGWQYQHSAYQQLLKDNGIIQSMSRKGNSIDDALMENFFGLLKTEMFYDQEDKYKNINELEQAIHEYIYYYNNDRIKERLKGLTPIEYRNQSLIQTV